MGGLRRKINEGAILVGGRLLMREDMREGKGGRRLRSSIEREGGR